MKMFIYIFYLFHKPIYLYILFRYVFMCIYFHSLFIHFTYFTYNFPIPTIYVIGLKQFRYFCFFVVFQLFVNMPRSFNGAARR